MFPIESSAFIILDSDDGSQIHIKEAYCAFVWTLSHAVLTLYREHGNGISGNEKAMRALYSLSYGFSLYTEWHDWRLDYPNPQEYDLDVDPNIIEANGLYMFAVSFILAHEFYHHRLGHDLSLPDEYIENEFRADLVAVETFIDAVKGYNSEKTNSAQIGAIIGIGSLLFPDDCWEPKPGWDGKLTHPNTEERIFRVIEMLSKGDDDSVMWEFGIMILAVWGFTMDKELYNPTGRNSAKEDYKAFAQHLKDQQNCL